MTAKTEQYSIRRGRIEIDVPHKDSNITFVYEKHGPDTYANVAGSINKAGLIQPTMAEIASLVHQAFNADEPEFNEIKQLMKDRWLWGFTGSLYIPRKGAYIQDNPAIKDGMPYIDESELVRKLEANDKTVRFVQFGYKTGEMTSLQLAKNEYVRALAGDEGAEKLAEVADKHKYKKPYLYSFESVDKPLTKVSALDSGWYVDGHRLGVDGDLRGGSRYGYGLGVRKTGEASRAKK